MEPSLSRTASSESTQSWQQLATASGASATSSRKARSSEPETGAATVERASVSVPSLSAKAIRQSLPGRRASKASDSSFLEYLGSAWSGSAIDETDGSSTLENSRASLASGPVNPQLLPDSFRHGTPAAAAAAAAPAESKRLSISSFVSALSHRGYSWSGRSSVAGSEPEGAYVMRLDRPGWQLFSHMP